MSTKRSNCFECHYIKASHFDNNKRFLVIINVLGSAGPLKIVVNEEDTVGKVIDTSLKMYAKEGRLPTLAPDPTKFLLYCAHTFSEALSPWDEIGSCGARNFVLSRKPEHPSNITEARSSILAHSKRGGKWRVWLNKSLSLKISSH